MDEPRFRIFEETAKIPTLEEIEKHFKENFHYENGRLVPNEPQPVILDYITTLETPNEILGCRPQL